jgi:dTDP-glucose 4,6-dehydratase
MRVVVTGGAGFIGSAFVDRILNNPETQFGDVLVVDRLTYAGNLRNLAKWRHEKRLKFLEANICDVELMEATLEKNDYVVNFAAESHVDNSIKDSEAFIRTNVLGTHSLLQASKQKEIARFLQVSTDEVYGSINSGSWDENFLLSPNSPYAASKASGDLMVRSFHKTYGLDTVITRCSNNYGTRQFPEKLIPVVIKSLLSGKKIPVYGDGKNVRDWMHVDDHCYGIELALLEGKAGEIYNIGGGTELSNLDIVREIIELMEMSFDSISFVEDRKGHDFRYSVDYKKIHDELGYSPKVNFKIGLKETVRWYLDNLGHWWEDKPKNLEE